MDVKVVIAPQGAITECRGQGWPFEGNELVLRGEIGSLLPPSVAELLRRTGRRVVLYEFRP